MVQLVDRPIWYAALNATAPGAFPVLDPRRGHDGQKYEAVIADPPGFSRHGLDAAAVTKKFNAVTAKRLGESARARIIDAVMSLDVSPSCGALSKALATD